MSSDISVGYQNLPMGELAPVLLTAQGPLAVAGLASTTIPDDSGLLRIMQKFYNKLLADGLTSSGRTVDAFLWQFNSNNSNPNPGYPIPFPTDYQQFAELFIKFERSLAPNSVLNANEQAIADLLAKSLLVMTQSNLGIRSDLASSLEQETESYFGLGNSLDFFIIVDSTQNYSQNYLSETVSGLAGFSNLGNFGFSSINELLDELGKRAFAATIQYLSSQNFTATNSLGTQTEVINAINAYQVRFAFLKDYYRAFVAYDQGAIADFRNSFTDFIQNAISALPSNTATFNSSQEFSTWLTNLSKNYIAALSGSETLTASSVSGSFPKVRILQRIYALIVEMIGIIQKTTASQSDTLRIYTLQQSEMTNLVGKIHIFTSSDGSELANDADPSAATHINELTSVTSAWGDKIRASRDRVKSDAQAQQTNVNNSNDAVNQQASMATSFIQELSTLLAAIYR